MSFISLRFGRFRLYLGRFLNGGFCPLNVLGRNFQLIPSFKKESKENPKCEVDLSPATFAGALLSKILNLLGQREENRG